MEWLMGFHPGFELLVLLLVMYMVSGKLEKCWIYLALISVLISLFVASTALQCEHSSLNTPLPLEDLEAAETQEHFRHSRIPSGP